ncbi:hypothetical protein GCM10017691_11010 [Pseudonocardia petroleophila]|uniref:DUF4267 domain-containing protein n=1 Tax=Pseudonocardia petroleophila TaxID=37331 RepID=A0A7G7MIY2_9PSEU|nr:hypothetical protein [Pseudonocardia petroleophila]QNG52743.1 hypothetical protein H6H00_01345 [Pseudonocardia petroleophila]
MTATVRAVWGAVLLAAPDAVFVLATRPRSDEPRRARAVLRVLGARHLAQAGLVVLRPGPGVSAVSAAVDGVHAATCLGLAALDRRWRRPALLDAAVAAAFCLATARKSTGSS